MCAFAIGLASVAANVEATVYWAPVATLVTAAARLGLRSGQSLRSQLIS